jgi:hypothetical protein
MIITESTDPQIQAIELIMKRLNSVLDGLARFVRAGAFAACCLALLEEVSAEDFTYVTNGGVLTITGYIGPGGAVSIPSTIHGLPVAGIGDSAFLGLTDLLGVIIPDSVTNIGDQAFLNCSGLASLSIGTGVTQISGGGARNMFGTFAGCTSLTNLTIPASVTNITDGVLTRGGGLGAFSYCNGLTNVIIGNGLRYLGVGTFALCHGLKRVSIADSVTTIGDFAFHLCDGLTEVNLGRGVTQIGPGTGYAFDGCTNLASVRIPGNVTNLGHYAFAYCSGLASISLEDGLEHLGAYALAQCTILTNITVPASVTVIHDMAFALNPNLAGVFFKGNPPLLEFPEPYGLFYGSSNVTVYYLPGSIGWEPTFSGRPTMLWNPEPKTDDGSFGVRQNRFGFNITGTADIPIVIEASASVASQQWIPLQNSTLTNGLIYFSDSQSTNHPTRCYRIRSP